jgi:hypothetical protein
MADNNRSSGYRANDPYGRPRAEPTARPQGDPLAELARLIGQQNESAPSYRQNGASVGAQAGAPVGAYDQGHAADNWSQPAPDAFAKQDSFAQHDAYGARGYSEPSPQSGYGATSHDPRYADQRYAEQNYDSSQAYGDPNAPAYADPRYSDSYSQDPRYSDPRYSDPRYADPRYADPRYTDQRYADPQGYGADNGYQDPQGYSDPRYSSPSLDGQDYAQPQAGYPQGNYAHESAGYANMPSFARPGAQPGFPDPYYDSAPHAGMHMPMPEDHAPARRRGSIVTVLAVLALAVVGTAAAFGYRAMFGTSGTPVPPPVIKADPRPSKVVPVANDPNAKPIQDRVGANAERVVPREETPIDPTRASSPRVIFPNLAEQGQKPAAPAVAANVVSTGSAPAAGPAEPKKIRTVAIKPEQGGLPAARNAQAAAEPELANARGQANAPLALSPNAVAPAAPPPQRQAARGTTHGSAAFPAPISSGAGNAVAGPYAVQVTSQRSEADAQASYRSLQAQFPSVLGSRQPVIKKADLGDKGTYYRAQIPFQSQGEASEFCSSLKAAGGQCVVQKN